MRKTKLSQKISVINYFISALGNLKKGTNTNKFLLKVWFLSSTITFIISAITLAMIGTLSTDNIFIKLTIYVALFGISSILPSVLFSIIYYTSLILEKVNLLFNFIYLVIINEISIVKLIKVIVHKIKREFRLSNKELILHNINEKTLVDRLLNSFNVLAKIHNIEFKHTYNILVYSFIIFSVMFVTLILTLTSHIEASYVIGTIILYMVLLATISVILLLIYSLLKLIKFFPRIIELIGLVLLFIISLPITIPIFIYKLIIVIIGEIKKFFKEMKQEYSASKIEINSYIETKIKER